MPSKPIRSTKEKTVVMPKCRYLRSITLTNVRTFRSESKLDFCFPDGRLAQWTIILGENGTGKTTLLQYIGGMKPVLIRPEERLQPLLLARHFSAWNVDNLNATESSKMCSLSTKLVFSDACLGLDDKQGSWSKLNQASWRLSIRFRPHQDDYLTYAAGVMDECVNIEASLENELLIVAYGASRHVASSNSPYLTSDAFQDVYDSGIGSLMQDDIPLMSPEQWLLGLDHQSKGTTAQHQKMADALHRAINCLCGVLPDVSEITIAPTGGPLSTMAVFFHTPFGKVRFSSLSLGYRATAAWIIDFVRRMHIRYPALPEPEKGPAVVLIDEFDLHMHVRWQMEMMDLLTKSFPNTQFIITAHSPLIIQAADGKANVAVLKRVPTKDGGEEVIIENDPAYVRGWRLDQLVTSDLYGIQSSRAKTYTALMDRRRVLLQKETLTTKESAELKELTERLDREAPPDSSPAQQWLEEQLKAAKAVTKAVSAARNVRKPIKNKRASAS